MQFLFLYLYLDAILNLEVRIMNNIIFLDIDGVLNTTGDIRITETATVQVRKIDTPDK